MTKTDGEHIGKADQKSPDALAFPLPQMSFSHTNAFAISVPVASRNNGVALAEQLFDDLIDKALTYSFDNKNGFHRKDVFTSIR